MDREGFMVSIEPARVLSLRLYLCVSAISKPSYRKSERETATDSYKQLVDHESDAWSEFQPAHSHVE